MNTKALVAVLALLVGALLVAGIVNFVQRRRTRAKNKEVATQRCGAAPENRRPIFIMMVCVGDAECDAGLRTLISAFANATCPLRLTAGVAEYATPRPSRKPLAERFTVQCDTTTVPFQLGHHVKVLAAPQPEFPGRNIALEQVQRYLYHDERYVCVLAPGTVLAPEWDATLVRALGEGDTATVVTARPGPPSAKLGTYTAVTHPRPSFGTYALKLPADEVVPDTVPALAWSAALSFSQGPLPFGGPASPADADAQDAFMTARLLLANWRFEHPCARVATRGTAPPDAHAGAVALPPAVCEYLGVTPDGGGVRARGRLGLLPAPNSAAELALKIGSAGDVLSTLARIETAQRHHGGGGSSKE